MLPKDRQTTKKNVPARLYWCGNCGLHPLIHTLLDFNLAQDIERWKTKSLNFTYYCREVIFLDLPP